MSGEMLFTYFLKSVWTSFSTYLKNKQVSCARLLFTVEELLPAEEIKGNAFSVFNLSLIQLFVV